MNYQTASELLSTARSREAGKPLCNKTRLFERPEGIAIKQHNTDIILFRPDGSIVVDTDGWHTVTTKVRLNEYLEGFRVWSESRVLYFSYKGEEYPFKDGMVLSPDGTVEGAGDWEESGKLQKMKRKVDRMVNKFIKGFIQDIKDNGLEAPGAGDCLYCQLQDKDDKGMSMSVDHIILHMEECYYVPGLLWKAVQRAGNPSFVFQWAMEGNPELVESFLRHYLGERKVAMAKHLLNGGN